MKRVLMALALLAGPLPSAAFAQVNPEAYSVATPAQFQFFGSATSVGITSGIVNRLIRTTCTAACYINITVSGSTVAATKATGVYLPADTPTLFSVTPGSKVQVIGDTASGRLHVQELSR